MQGQSEALTDTRPVEHSYEYRFLSDSMVPLKNPVGEDITYNKTAGKAVTEKTDLGVWLKEHAAGSSCYGNTNLVPAFCKAYTKWTQTDALAVHTAKGSTQIADWVPGTPGYSMILEKGKAAVLKAETQYTVRHIFFVWLQGESDAIAGTPKSLYKEKIASLAAALEKDLSIEKFGIIRVGQFTNDERDEEIIAAQSEIGEENNRFLILTEKAVELNKIPEYRNPQIDGHFSAKGLERLGRLAGEALGKFAAQRC